MNPRLNAHIRQALSDVQTFLVMPPEKRLPRNSDSIFNEFCEKGRVMVSEYFSNPTGPQGLKFVSHITQHSRGRDPEHHACEKCKTGYFRYLHKLVQGVN